MQWVMEVVMLAAMVAAVAIPSLIVIRYGRSVDPVHTHPEIKSGFGGAMCVFVFGQVAWFLRALWESTFVFEEALGALAQSSDLAVPTAVALLPTLAALVLCPWMLWELTHRRTPSALAFVVVSLWVLGPCVAMAQSWYFALELTPWSQLQLFGWAIAWTAYFAVSPRVALTYGTVRAARLLSGDKSIWKKR